jgi:hypothetical protein
MSCYGECVGRVIDAAIDLEIAHCHQGDEGIDWEGAYDRLLNAVRWLWGAGGAVKAREKAIGFLCEKPHTD